MNALKYNYMKNILLGLISILFVLVSCKQKGNQDNDSLINKIEEDKIKAQLGKVKDVEAKHDNETTAVYETKMVAKKVNAQETKPFILFDSNDTLFIPESGKVQNINKINDEVYFYTEFESYKKETDFGKKTLFVRDNDNKLLWNTIVEDYTQLLYNNQYILMVYYEKDVLSFYNYKDGSVIKSIKLNQNLSDGNQFLMTNESTYIKLVDEEDATTKDVLVIDNNSFEKKLLNLNLNDYYSLGKENNRIYLQSGDDKKYLN